MTVDNQNKDLREQPVDDKESADSQAVGCEVLPAYEKPSMRRRDDSRQGDLWCD